MAPNKFATMLHRNTNKITLVLIYAILEWILILLLLLNSLFSYLIIKYAEFFGLRPPCLWCTRLDPIFDPQKNNKNLLRDLLCEVHAREISKLGYCSNHHKLVRSQIMCEHCLSSRPELQGFSDIFSLFRWTKEYGAVPDLKEKVGENGKVSCSCCGVRLDNTTHCSNSYSYILLKTPSWDVLECAQKEILITKDDVLYNNHIQDGSDSESDKKNISDFSADLWDDEKVVKDKDETEMEDSVELTENVRKEMMKEMKGVEVEKEDEVLEMEEKNEIVEEKATLIMGVGDTSVQACAPLEISPQHLEFFLDYGGHKLVHVELVDLIAEESHAKDNVKIEDSDKAKVQGSGKVFEVEFEQEEDSAVKNRSRSDEMEVVLDLDINEEPRSAMLDSMALEEDENSLDFYAKDNNLWEEFEQFTYFPLTQLPSEDFRDVQEMTVAAREMNLDVRIASEELAQTYNNENEDNVSTGTDFLVLEMADETENQESVHSYECTYEDPSASSDNLDEADDHGPMQVEEQMVELKCLPVQDIEHILNNQPSLNLELNDTEEDKVPETPASIDGLNQLHIKLGFLERGDSEESLDGSVTDELECTDGAVSIECLKTALRAERKNLQAMYVELEEERSACAVAVNQTMAMINRLQEEKAAMQMEALQYQRMMEEQCDYDQEALLLMNEIAVKRQQEKRELEKELEVYRKKLLYYEKKEKGVAEKQLK